MSDSIDATPLVVIKGFQVAFVLHLLGILNPFAGEWVSGLIIVVQHYPPANFNLNLCVTPANLFQLILLRKQVMLAGNLIRSCNSLNSSKLLDSPEFSVINLIKYWMTATWCGDVAGIQ